MWVIILLYSIQIIIIVREDVVKGGVFCSTLSLKNNYAKKLFWIKKIEFSRPKKSGVKICYFKTALMKKKTVI